MTAVFTTLLLSGCNRPQGKTPPPPDPEVAVLIVQTQKVRLTTELPGRTSSYVISEIKPQVNGLIQKRLFVEGSDVKAGQVLYEIDPAPFLAAQANAEANLDAAKKAADRARAAMAASIAGVAREKAVLELAEINRLRKEPLVKKGAASTFEYDECVRDKKVAEASVNAAEAQVLSDHAAIAAAEAAAKQSESALETARINLGYTKITAPIAGRIGRSTVTEGAIVTAYQMQALATIHQLDPIYVDVPQSTAELNRLKRSLEAGHLWRNSADPNMVKLNLEDGTAYAQEGALKFCDVKVDPTTGSVILRIVIPNPQGVLLPGMFVRAIIEEGINEQAILIPQQAVTRTPKGDPQTLIVDAEGKVQQRGLVIDRAIGDKWLLTSGLAQGDRVIVEGMQKVRPGATVKMVEAVETNAVPPAPATSKVAQSN